MKLYHAPGACSLAPHIVASEAGIPLELVKVDLAKHTLPDGSDYYRVSPRGYVPLLELDNGERMSEASVLVQYLADQAPESGLIPRPGTPERYKVQEWLNVIATELHKGFSPLWDPTSEESVKAKAVQRIGKRFAELDARLAERPYLAGETFSVVDAYAFTIANWANFQKLDLAPYPHLSAWMARVAARPKVQAALKAEGLAG